MNGLLVQWGRGYKTSYTFPLAYKYIPVIALGGVTLATEGSTNNKFAFFKTLSATGFTCARDWNADSDGGSWIAIGIAAI
jgi:hypothetical protein